MVRVRNSAGGGDAIARKPRDIDGPSGDLVEIQYVRRLAVVADVWLQCDLSPRRWTRALEASPSRYPEGRLDGVGHPPDAGRCSVRVVRSVVERDLIAGHVVLRDGTGAGRIERARAVARLMELGLRESAAGEAVRGGTRFLA